eukprot:2590696-Amphidinium_carterae.1
MKSGTQSGRGGDVAKGQCYCEVKVKDTLPTNLGLKLPMANPPRWAKVELFSVVLSGVLGVI